MSQNNPSYHTFAGVSPEKLTKPPDEGPQGGFINKIRHLSFWPPSSSVASNGKKRPKPFVPQFSASANQQCSSSAVNNRKPASSNNNRQPTSQNYNLGESTANKNQFSIGQLEDVDFAPSLSTIEQHKALLMLSEEDHYSSRLSINNNKRQQAIGDEQEDFTAKFPAKKLTPGTTTNFGHFKQSAVNNCGGPNQSLENEKPFLDQPTNNTGQIIYSIYM